MKAPEGAGSAVVVHRLSRPVACGTLVPQPGIKPTSPALEGRFLTTGPPGKSRMRILKMNAECKYPTQVANSTNTDGTVSHSYTMISYAREPKSLGTIES